MAITKATSSRFAVPPKEKHVVRLRYAVSGSSSDASYVANSLLKRLKSAKDWLTALKSLIVIHRLMRETEGTAFMQEIIRAGEGDAKGRGGRVLGLDNFMDTTNIEGRFDYSEWVRAYSRYLDESLDVFMSIKWHVDMEKSGQKSKLASDPPEELLEEMPAMQRMQRCLINCVPRGQAERDHIVLTSLSLVVRESFKLYKALSEGVINLLDLFFTFDYVNAAKGLSIYRETVSSSEALSGFYSSLKAVDAIDGGLELPQLELPSGELLESMETYAKQAPRPERGGDEGGEYNRRNAPLRKGRLSLPSPGKQAVPESKTADGSTMHDPGMLLSPEASFGVPLSENEASQPDGQETEVDVKDEDLKSQPTPDVDLLDFETLPESQSNGNGVEQQNSLSSKIAASQTEPQAPKTAMDLLGELDFGSLSVSGNGGDRMVEGRLRDPAKHHVPVGAAAIPDALVVRAAVDVYGRPTSLAVPTDAPLALPSPSVVPTPGGQYGAHGSGSFPGVQTHFQATHPHSSWVQQGQAGYPLPQSQGYYPSAAGNPPLSPYHHTSSLTPQRNYAAVPATPQYGNNQLSPYSWSSPPTPPPQMMPWDPNGFK